MHRLLDGPCQLFLLEPSGCKRQDGTRDNALMLLPLIDMCNHSFEANAKILQEKEASDEKMLVKVCGIPRSLILMIKDMYV